MKIIVVLCFCACVWATKVDQCDQDNPIPDLTSRVDIGGCTKRPCKLIKDHFMNITLKFTPTTDIKGLKNRVTAEILGSALPFVGVDGKNACNNVFDDNGSKLAKCDMKGGQTYIYKNGFEIYKIYPKLETTVHWELVPPNGKSVICFEVPVQITN